MQRKQILWIDDEVEFFRAHIMFLEARGYDVTPSYNGDDGLDILRKKQSFYDVVLLDEQMPGKDGLTVLAEIKKFLPDLPVVMVTKSEEEDLMERAIGKKIDAYLTKPVNPSQILMVCKRLLQSQEILSDLAKKTFVKSYSEIKNTLQNNDEMNSKDWVKIYQQLVRRELDTENVDDEGIRQNHWAQRAETNIRFSEFVMQNYPLWIKKDQEVVEKPTLSNEIIQKYVVPEINNNPKFALFVLDSIQLDQFVMIQRFLRKIFLVSGTYFYFSALPTTPAHSFCSLITGLLPADLEKVRPDLLNDFLNGADIREAISSFGFSRMGSEKKPMFFNMLKNNLRAEDVIEQMSEKNGDKNFLLVYNDFLELLQSYKQSKFVKDLISSPKMFRDMTAAWFEKSELFKLFQALSLDGYTIALTPASGNILCTTNAHFYGTADDYSNLRFRSGEKIDADERIGFHILNPRDYGLPAKTANSQVNILNSNFYFAPKDYHKHSAEKKRSTGVKAPLSFYDKGGVSLEEVVVPLAIMRPLETQIDTGLF